MPMAPPKPSQPAGATSLDGAIAALKPVLTGALAAVDAAGPYVMKAWSAGAHAWARLEAFGGPDMAQVVLGAVRLATGAVPHAHGRTRTRTAARACTQASCCSSAAASSPC